MKIHRVGQEIRDVVSEGKVLTFAPLFPMEGGLEIYEEFVTGPFAWRRAHLISENMRKNLRVLYEADLEEFLRADPPAAILVGHEKRFGLEDAFIEYAETNGYAPVTLSNGATLWVAPD